MKTAVLFDGAFFIKRLRRYEPVKGYDPKFVADTVHRIALLHLLDNKIESELYRIFFYDCPPLEKREHNPITNICIDFSKSKEAIFRKELHTELLKKRKLALRLGTLSKETIWDILPEPKKKLIKNQIQPTDLTESDIIISTRQKGVDMRIGLDIASLSLKKQVDKIILIAGDADFVPAAKLARREGVDFVLDPMRTTISKELDEHIDGLKSVWPPKANNHKPPRIITTTEEKPNPQHRTPPRKQRRLQQQTTTNETPEAKHE